MLDVVHQSKAESAGQGKIVIFLSEKGREDLTEIMITELKLDGRKEQAMKISKKKKKKEYSKQRDLCEHTELEYQESHFLPGIV